jgi:hypothetical protein
MAACWDAGSAIGVFTARSNLREVPTMVSVRTVIVSPTLSWPAGGTVAPDGDATGRASGLSADAEVYSHSSAMTENLLVQLELQEFLVCN